MRTKSIVLPIVVTLITVVIAPSVPAQPAGVPQTPLGTVRGPNTVKELFSLERSIQSAIEEVEPAIVAIGNRFGRKNTAQLSLEGSRFASGVIISEDGLVLSQYHVSHEGVVDEEIGLCVFGEPGQTVEVILADGRRLEGKLLGGDRLADISLLQLNVPGTYPYATLASVDRPTLGQWAIKLGHPAGYQPSRGVSARLGRVIYANDLNLVASCRTQGGDSGGPIIDSNAKILGLIQTSLMPFELSQLAQQRDEMPIAYMSSRRIQEKLSSIKSRVVRDTLQQDYFDRQRQYATVTETLPGESVGLGMGIQAAYAPCVGSAASSVVEVLGTEDKRIAFGTIVSSDGLVVTKASQVKSDPVCRLHNGNQVQAIVIGKDQQLDVALLKLNVQGLLPLPFGTDVALRRGTMLLAPSRGQQWDIGIVSAPIHEKAIGQELSDVDPTQLLKQFFPNAFEHDIPIDVDMLGGPVLNLRGDFLGVTIARAGNHGNVALPADSIKRVVAQLQLANGVRSH